MCNSHNDVETSLRLTELIKEYRKLMDDYLWARHLKDFVWMERIHQRIEDVCQELGIP